MTVAFQSRRQTHDWKNVTLMATNVLQERRNWLRGKCGDKGKVPAAIAAVLREVEVELAWRENKGRPFLRS
jgi:hypothetical protein